MSFEFWVLGFELKGKGGGRRSDVGGVKEQEEGKLDGLKIFPDESPL